MYLMLKFMLLNNKLSNKQFNNLVKVSTDDSKLELFMKLIPDSNLTEETIKQEVKLPSLTKIHVNFIKYVDIIIKHSNEELLQDMLSILCKNGKLACVKHVFKKIKISNKSLDLNFNNDILFRKACTSGNLLLIKYLYKLGIKKEKVININAWKDNAFKRACKYNHNSVIKYLYCLSLKLNKPIDINLGSNYCFRIACKNGNEFLVRFLYRASIVKGKIININNLNDQAFKWACEFNHYHIVSLLWKFSKKHKMPIDVKQNDDEIFIHACQKNYINTVNLLMAMNPNYYYLNIFNNEITEYGILTDARKSLNILQNEKKSNPCNVLGITKITKKQKDEQCTICYTGTQEINNNNKIVKLCCNHVHCLECLLILHNQQYEDELLSYFECAFCKKSSNWKDCVIIKKIE